MDRRKKAAGAYRKVQNTPAAEGQAQAGEQPDQKIPSDSGFNAAGKSSEKKKSLQDTSSGKENPPLQNPSSGLKLKEPGFLKTGRGGPGIKKAAKLLVLLGKSEASAILRHMSEAEIELLTEEIARLGRIDQEEGESLLKEFQQTRKSLTHAGGPDTALRILTAAFGGDKAAKLLRKVVPEAVEQPFSFMHELEYHQIITLLKGESPQVVSLVLSYLDPAKAGSVLESFPKDLQVTIARRMAKLEKVDPQVLSSLDYVLKERVHNLGKVVTEKVEGKQVLATILKNLSPDKNSLILDSLDREQPELASQIRDQLFTMEDLVRVRSRDLADILREYDDKEIAIILKGKSEEFTQAMQSALSNRRNEEIGYISAELGRIPRTEVNELTADLLNRVREKVEAGDIVLPGNSEYL